MAEISMEVVIGQLLGVLNEAFEHPPKPWTYFTDNSAEAFGEAVGAIAHVAYHLGAIRQKVAFGQKS